MKMKNLLVLFSVFFLFALSGCDFFNQTTTEQTTLQTTAEATTQTTTEAATQTTTEATVTTTISETDVITTESELTLQLTYIYNLAMQADAFDGTYEEWLETVSGPAGQDGREVTFQVSADGYIQWQYVGDTTWTNLIELATLVVVGPAGADGTNGTDGLSAYEIYVRNYPEYTGTEEEWITDLINGNLMAIIEYTVSFDSQGGTDVEDAIVQKGALLSIPVISRIGYTLEGWYTSLNGGTTLDEKWIFTTNVVNNDITLYAKWDMKELQILNWNIGAEPETLDPTLNWVSEGGDVINNTFEGLVRDVGGVISPGIAETWETSANGLTITFHLRESKWSDGSDLTAEDFVYSWKRGMDPATASIYVARTWECTNIVGAADAVYNGGSLDDVGITAVDDYTLEVELTVPTPYFVSFMAFYNFMPVKQSAVEATGGANGEWAKMPTLVVSNGPFKLSEYEAGVGLKLIKNDQYWNADEVYLDTINGKFINLATTAYVNYMSGDLDVLPSVPNSMTAALIAEDPNFYRTPVLGTYYYSFNMEDADGTWDNLNLRKALNYAIDRTAITEELSDGQIPATGFVPYGFLDDEENDFAETSGDFGIPTDNSKFTEAVQLFATAAGEMNMTVVELQSYLNGKVILYNTSESHKLVAEMVQESWKQVLGIEVTIENQDWTVFSNNKAEGHFDISRGGWINEFMDPVGMLTLFTSDNYFNDPSYDSVTYDVLMSEAQLTIDNATHFEKLYAAEAILMGDLPIIPIYYYADVYLIKDYVVGWGRSALGSLDFTHTKIEK